MIRFEERKQLVLRVDLLLDLWIDRLDVLESRTPAGASLISTAALLV
jgi:hypothetical protein